ncbi:YgjP-like metallopeptidase domain-containing protein, partial [Noviherbaspirillum sp.]|uniref:YgjP-like metallopeptidase domain-containing protein n=1 Tax=Noviherbaspirillum sp. TaxID=1926288 RepID=UPI002D3EA270
MKLLRQTPPDPQQLSLQLDFFSPDYSSRPAVDQPAPAAVPAPALPPADAPELQPSPAAPQPGRRRVQVQDHLLEYRLQRSKRRSIGFVIDEDGLRITAPKWVTVAEIENAIREKQRWIFTKLNERRERSARRLQPH